MVQLFNSLKTPHSVSKERRWFEFAPLTDHVQHHVIHPVTLDAAAQLIFLALTEGKWGGESTAMTIPTRIRH